MKKIIVALVVLAIAAPAMATDVDAVQIGGSEVKITYDASGDPELVRAFGIDITLDSDANFVDTNDTSADYPIFPGSVVIDMFGDVSNYGTPIGSVDDHPDTQQGLDFNNVTIEMGSLYAGGDPAPSDIGDLLVLEIGNVGNSPVIPPVFNVSMANNTARGGIVLEGGGGGSSYTGAPLYYSTLSRSEYITWLAWGGGDPSLAPANWRGWCWKCGDANASGDVTFGDVLAIWNYFQTGDTTGQGDINMSGDVTFGDVLYMWTKFQVGAGCGSCP